VASNGRRASESAATVGCARGCALQPRCAALVKDARGTSAEHGDRAREASRPHQGPTHRSARIASRSARRVAAAAAVMGASHSSPPPVTGGDVGAGVGGCRGIGGAAVGAGGATFPSGDGPVVGDGCGLASLRSVLPLPRSCVGVRRGGSRPSSRRGILNTGVLAASITRARDGAASLEGSRDSRPATQPITAATTAATTRSAQRGPATSRQCQEHSAASTRDAKTPDQPRGDRRRMQCVLARPSRRLAQKPIA
jgi:hypothetical protein